MVALRVLIVDDDRDYAESLADALVTRGLQVSLAFSSEEAIERFREACFDAVLLDVQLPGRNGVESFFEIRKMVPDAKAIMMTGYSVQQLVEQTVANGAWDVLYEPFDLGGLLAKLERIRPGGLLLAEEDPDCADRIQSLLVGRGYRVALARTGQEAIQYARSNSFDMLILDLRLPIINGLEVYRNLRESGHQIPTIVVTALAYEEIAAIEQLRNASVSHVLLKPFDPEQLLNLMEHLVRRPSP